MSVTLKWMIYESNLEKLNCVTCLDKLDTPISGVNILDNPDVVKWIKHNELVLTTGYIFKDNTERQLKLIRDLHEAGCSALGIKVKRFFKSIPEIMLDEAEKIGLPLIEIPFYYSFSDISKTVYQGIYSAEVDSVQKEQKLIADLSDMFFNYNTIFEMLYRIYDFLGKSVLLLNRDKVIENMVIGKKHSGLYFRGDTIETQGHDSFILKLPGDVGFLFILDEMQGFSDYYRLILQKVGTILAMSLERKGNQKNISNSDNFSYSEQFMEFLTRQNDVSQEQIIYLCNLAGFDYKKKRICITFSLKNVTNEKEKKEVNNIIRGYIKDKQRVPNCENLTMFECHNSNALCIFLLSEVSKENPDFKKAAYHFADELKSSIKNKTGFDIPVGMSRSHIHTDDIQGAYMEAVKAMFLNQSVGQKDKVASFYKQTHYHFLSKCTQNELKNLYMNNVEYLERYDKENDTELLPTLKMYFMSCFNASETAKKMFVHRNTLSNRLEKIKDILDLSFEDMEEWYALYLEMCAADLLE